MKNSTQYLRKLHVKKSSSPELFNLDKYIEKDKSWQKREADLWRTGNFKDLVKEQK